MIPPIAAPERILVMGGPNAGKSTTWIKWSERMERTFVLDTDFATERMLAGDYEGEVKIGDVEWTKYGPVHVLIPREWEDYRAFGKFTKRHTTKQDLIVVDMTDKPWDVVKQDVVERVFKVEIDELYLDKKITAHEAGKMSSPLADAHGNLWDVINKRYKTFQDDVFYMSRGHILGCSPVSAVDRERDSDETLGFPSKWGVKPTGQKNIGHVWHTVLLLSDTKDGHKMTTLKERSIKGVPDREFKVAEVYEDFVLDYLVLVAGWKM